MNATIALVRLRLRQAVAGRLPALAFVQLAVVGAIVLLAPGPDGEARLRTVLGATLGAAALVAAVGAVSFGAALLPDDRESRRIHRLLAAPTGPGALAASTVLATMVSALALALLLALVSLPLVPLAGGPAARDSVLASTVRLGPAGFEVAGEPREVDGRVSIDGRNPAVAFPFRLDPEDLAPGDVHGRILVQRRLDRHGSPEERVPVAVRIDDRPPVVTELGPDGVVPVTVPGEIARAGPFRVVLRRLDANYVLWARRDALVLDGRRRTFLPEYGLAALGAGLVAALLAAAGSAVGAVASPGIAVAAALLLGLVGLMRGFLATAAESLRLGLGHHGPGPAAEPTWLQSAAARFVEAVAAASPDLGALGMGGPLRDGSTATLPSVLPGLDDLAAATAICLLLAWACLRRSEFP